MDDLLTRDMLQRLSHVYASRMPDDVHLLQNHPLLYGEHVPNIQTAR